MDFPVAQMDVILALYGFSFMLLAASAHATKQCGMSRDLPWAWLSAFALLHGVAEWSGMATLAWGPVPALTMVQLTLEAGSWLLLLEFARRSGGRKVPAWVTLLLLALAGLGAVHGLAGLALSLGLALRLPASLWAGWVLINGSRRQRPDAPGLGLAGFGLAVYGLLDALMALGSGPAPLIGAGFGPLTGLPADLLRTVPVLLAALGLARHQKALVEGQGLTYRQRRFPLGFGLLLVLGLGVAGADLGGWLREAQLRRLAVEQGGLAAAWLPRAELEALKGTAADLKTPAYRKIKGLLRALIQARPGTRFAYIMALRGPLPIFLVDAEDEASPDFSPPGQVYTEATPAVLDAFAASGPRMEGPSTDRWGTWISVLAPVRAPDGRTLAMLGVDFPAEGWKREVALSRLTPLALALLVSLLLLLAFLGSEESRRFHRLLAASETRYRALFEHSGDGMFLMGDVFLDCNEEVLRMWRCNRDQVLGRGPWDYSPPFQPDGRDSRNAASEHIRATLRGEPQRFDWTHRRSDGSLIETEVMLNRVLVDGKPLVLASMRDVSSQRHLTRALEESERRLARAQRAAQVGSWELDLASKELRGSDEAFRIWGLPPGDQPLPFYRVQTLIHAEDRARVDRCLEELVREGKACDLVYRLRRVGDATLRIVRVVAETEPGGDGRPSRVLGAIQDVTENARVDERLRQAEKMESIGKLAGGLAHDFNNMLTPILGFAEVAMLKVPLGGPGHEELARIAEAAARASELTRQVLAFSRRQLLDTRPMDLNAVLGRMEPLLKRLLGGGVRLELHASRGLGEIKADPTQIEQAILNLAVNARDAMPSGGALVLETANAEVDDAYARKHTGAQPGRFVLLAVSDTGVGMDLATQRHLFEPFFTTKGSSHSAGLGLATAYGIVRQHGGFITVSSEPGQGSTFRVFLPRSAPSAAPQAADAAASGARGSETVLVVDDEVLVRQLASSLLANKGYQVLEAADGHQALEIAQHHPGPIQLLITDLIMPHLNGRDLAAQLAVLRPGLRVLFMSGHAHDLLGPQAGLDASTRFIQKPFRLELFERTVREILDKPA